MSDLGKRLGRRIYQFRKKSGLTQAQTGERSGLSDEFISAVERGAKLPSLPALERIASVLKVEIKDLFNFDNSPYRQLESLSKEVLELALSLQSLPLQQRKLVTKILRVIAGGTT